MTDGNNQKTKVEGRLDALDENVRILKDDVRILKDDVRVLKHDVHRLGVLHEEHDTKIRTIAEIQAHHGTVLEEIRVAVAPLRDLEDFVRRVVDNHERRISALEDSSGTER